MPPTNPIKAAIPTIKGNGTSKAKIATKDAPAMPHITLAVAKGVQPVYSNTLLLSADAHRVAVDLTLDAAYFFG